MLDNSILMLSEFDSIPLKLIRKAYNDLVEYPLVEITKNIEYSNEWPMWQYMWMTEFDNLIIENLDEISNIGFRVYEDKEEGYIFLAIDACGFDFFEAYWDKLYELLFL